MEKQIKTRIECRWECEECGSIGPLVTPQTIGIVLHRCNKDRTELIKLSDNTNENMTNQEWVARVHSVIFHRNHVVTIHINTVVDLTNEYGKNLINNALSKHGC